MTYFLLGILCFYFLFAVISTITLSTQFKYYKATYIILRYRSYLFDYKSYGNYYYKPCNEKGSNYNSIVFCHDKSIGLLGGEYLYLWPITWASPYSLYWYIKLHRWFKKNKPLVPARVNLDRSPVMDTIIRDPNIN